MNYLTNKYGEPAGSSRQPLNTQNGGLRIYSQPEIVTYNGKVASGVITEVQIKAIPILTPLGDRVGSYWGKPENLAYVRDNSISIVETNGAATCTVVHPGKNLENLFESLTGTVKRYVLKVTDNTQKVLYGWVRGVAALGDAYTLDIFNKRLTEGNQNWVGDIATFDSESIVKVEIFRYTSSIAFGTGTTLTEEVEMPFEFGTSIESVYRAIDSLTNGQFFVDYLRGFIIGRKADNTASETITYITYSGQISDVNGGGNGGVPNSWGVLDGRKIVTTAGTRVALTAGSTPFKTLTVQAEEDNMGDIVIGGVTVVASLLTRRGDLLLPSGSYHFAVPGDMANIYIDSEINGDGVTFIYTT